MTTRYTVVQGDCLSSIAKQFGIADWRTIYNDSKNAAFKQKRPNPNVIFPGDVLYIPDKTRKEVDRPAGARHKFKTKTQKTKVRIRLRNEDDAGFSGKKYELDIGGRKLTGTTAGDGLIEQDIPADAVAGVLTLWLDSDTSKPGLVWALKIGDLDPVEENSGIQARLKNLGFDPGPVDGIVGPKTSAAILSFQMKYGLPENGKVDSALRDRLRDIHDEG